MSLDIFCLSERCGTYDATAIWKLANSEDEAMEAESNTFSASERDPVRANVSSALDTDAKRALLTVPSLTSCSSTASWTVPWVLTYLTSVKLHVL